MEDGQDAVEADGLVEQGDEADDGDAQLDVEEPQEGRDESHRLIVVGHPLI